MGLITEKQLEEVWIHRGLRAETGRLWEHLVSYGLMPMTVPQVAFLNLVRERLFGDYLIREKGSRSGGRTGENTATGDGAGDGPGPAGSASGLPPAW